MKPAALALVAVAALLAPPREAQAVTFTGQSTTVARIFDVRHDLAGLDPVRTYRPVDEILRFTWDDIGGGPGSGVGTWRVDALLRGRIDLATGRTGGQEGFDVLLAHATWTAPTRALSFRIGRQQTITGLGWHAFDGVRLDFERLRRARFFIMGGVPVDLATNGAPDIGDWTWGAGATLVFPKHGTLGVDWEVRDVQGGGHEETAGLDLGLTWGSTSLAVNADYSVPLDRFGETAAALTHVIKGRHVLEARVTRIEPVFPTDSIWAVFTVNPFTERRLSWEQRGRRTRFGVYFADTQHATTPFPGPQDVQQAAATLMVDGARGARQRAEIVWQQGFSGDRLGGRWDGDWRVTPQLIVGGGASVNSYENAYRLTEQDEALALRGRIRHEHRGRWSLGLEVEQFLGRDRNTLRATLLFTTRFGQRRAEREWWGGRWGDAFARGPAVPRPVGPQGDDRDDGDDGDDSDDGDDGDDGDGSDDKAPAPPAPPAGDEPTDGGPR